MKRRNLLTASATVAILYTGGSHVALAQDTDDTPAITARVHGTFNDSAGGLGVLSADMSIVRFEVRNGTVAATGLIEGALSDSTGDVLGRVKEELTLPVEHVESTCNQLRIELAASDREILGASVHIDREVAGFDSRDGAAPKALGALCAAARLLRENPPADSLAHALNEIAVTVKRAAGSAGL